MITSVEELVALLVRYHSPRLDGEPARPLPAPGIALPRSLELIYETLGHHATGPGGLMNSQDELFAPDRIKIQNGEVAFVNENQGGWTCTYDAEAPEHPVYRYDDKTVGDLQCDRLDDFLITLALQESVMSSPWLGAFQDRGQAVSGFGPRLEDLHRNGLYAQDGPSHDFWVTEDREILCMRTSDWYWLGFYSESLKERIDPDIDCEIERRGDPQKPVTYRVGGEGSKLPFVDRVKRWFSR